MPRTSNHVKISGKDLIAAGTLTRTPLGKFPTRADKRLAEDLNPCASVLESLPATERRLEEIRLHQQEYKKCRKLQEVCIDG